MEDREDSSMFLEDAGGGQTLLVYCEGEEEALNNPTSGLLQDPREDMVWVVGGGGGGEEGVLLPDELGGETLLLLGDHLGLLPTPPDPTLLPQISAEEMPNNNNSNNNNNNSMRTATHSHTSATHTQRTYTNPKHTYTDAHTKSAAMLRMYTNPKLAYTSAHTNPIVTTTATTASAPKAYMNVHTESTQLRTYTNTKKSTYKNIQQQKTSVQEREANAHRQTHTLTNTQAHPFTQIHIQIKPQAPSPLTQTQTHTQTHPFTQTHTQAKTQPSLTLTHPHTQVHPHTQPPSPLTNTHPHSHPHTHPSPITDLSALRAKLVSGCKSSLDEDELSEEPFVGPSLRWATQTPKSYRGAKLRDTPLPPRKNGRKVPQRADTDGETSGMGSSVDEPVESSTESASEAPSTPPAFIQPRPSASRGPSSTSPTAIKKRRGGWPKGRKRKPELPGAKPPKAPLTAYVLFLNERRKYYRETRPELSFGAVTKVLGAEWSAMSVEQKAAFVSRSEQDKRRYRNELQAYRQSHDYQLLLRKKRIKNVIRRGGTTTEESSDFTDEIDDDDSEELYCRICDQLFTSLHNKREHLYGKTHLQAITGEYQRERLAEEERQMAAALRLGQGAGDCLTCGSPLTPLTPHTLHHAPARRGVDSLLVGCPSCSPSPAPPQSPRTPQEDDHDGDKEDEEEEEEEDGQDEEGVSSTPPSPLPPPSESITEALEGVMAKVMAREEEIHVLRRSSAAAVAAKEELSATLNRLQARGQRLGAARDALDRRNAELKAAAEALWRLPALFGVTPLQMVEVTTRISQEQQQDDTEIQEDGAEIEEQMKELQHQEEEEEEEEEEDILCQQEEQEEELVLQDEGIHLQQQDMEDVSQSEPKLVERLLMQHHESVLHSEGLVSDRDGLQQQQQQQQQVQNKAILQTQFLSQGENFHRQQQPSEKVQFLQLQLQEQQWPQQVQQQQQQEQQKLQLHQERLQQQQLIYVEDLQFNQHHQQQQQQQEEIAIAVQDEEVLQNQFLQQQQQQLGKKQVEEAEEVVISEEELHLLGQQLQPLQLGNQQQGELSDKLQIVEHEQSVLTKVQHPQHFLLNDQQIHLLQQQQQQQQQLLIIHENEGIQPQLPPPPPPPPPQQRQRQRQILLLEGKVDGTYSKQQEEDAVKETEEEDKKTAVTKQQQQQQQQRHKRYVLLHCPRHNTTQPHTYKLERDDMQQQVEKGHHKKTEGLVKHTLTQNSQTKQLQTPKQRDVQQKTRAAKNVSHKQDRLEQQQQFISQHVQQTDQQHFGVFSKPQQQRGRQPKQQKVTFVQQTAENTAGEHQKIHKTLSNSRTTKEPERGLLQHQGSMISIQHQPQTQVSRSISDEELFETSFDPQAFQGRLELELPEGLGLQEEEDLLQQDLFDLQHQEGEIGTRDLILLDNT